MARGLPTPVAFASLPAVAKAADGAGVRMPADLVWQTMAWASGWLGLDSTLAASAKTSSSRPDVQARTSVTRGFPSVRVPVLSNAMLLTRPMVSKAFPPLMSNPRRVANARPDAIAACSQTTRAQGQAIHNNSPHHRKDECTENVCQYV